MFTLLIAIIIWSIMILFLIFHNWSFNFAIVFLSKLMMLISISINCIIHSFLFFLWFWECWYLLVDLLLEWTCKFLEPLMLAIKPFKSDLSANFDLIIENLKSNRGNKWFSLLLFLKFLKWKAPHKHPLYWKWLLIHCCSYALLHFNYLKTLILAYISESLKYFTWW